MSSNRKRKYGYSHSGDGRCESANGSRYYSCDEEDVDSDDNRERSQTLYHSLSWEIVSVVNVGDDSDPSSNPLDGAYDTYGNPRGTDTAHESDVPGGHSTISFEQSIDPVSTLSKIIFLLFLCFIPIGDYFCLDIPYSLHEHILKDIDIHESDYTRLNSIVQWAVIVSSLFGGYLIDRILGVRAGIVLFACIMTISQIMLAVGGYIDSYWTMFVARLLYGVSRGPLGMIVYKLDVKWFRTSNMHFVFGLEKCIGQISNAININTMSLVYDGISSNGYQCLGSTLLISVGICIMSLIAALFVAVMDSRADRLRSMARHEPRHDRTVVMSDIKQFPWSYWCIVLTASVYYIGVQLFLPTGKLYFKRKYELDHQSADTVNGMVNLLSVLTLPVFGILLDKLGRSLTWMFVGLMLSLVSHLLLAFSFCQPFVATITLGVSYSILTATIWPMVAYVIHYRHIGTAYGIMTAVLTTGQASVVYITEYILDFHGYMIMEIFFTCCMLVAIFLGVSLLYSDFLEDGYLNFKSSDRKGYLLLS